MRLLNNSRLEIMKPIRVYTFCKGAMKLKMMCNIKYFERKNIFPGGGICSGITGKYVTGKIQTTITKNIFAYWLCLLPGWRETQLMSNICINRVTWVQRFVDESLAFLRPRIEKLGYKSVFKKRVNVHMYVYYTNTLTKKWHRYLLFGSYFIYFEVTRFVHWIFTRW